MKKQMNMSARDLRYRVEMALGRLDDIRSLLRVDEDQVSDDDGNDNHEAWVVARRAERSIGVAQDDLERHIEDIRNHFEGDRK